jgi:hypothetical protein
VIHCCGRKFIDTGFTAHHDVLEYWDGGALKVFRGVVTMTPDDKSKPPAHPTMTHFFYMDKADPSKVSHWYGAVGRRQHMISNRFFHQDERKP